MTDLRQTIEPKSDQLNADDLIGRTMTIKVTKVSLLAGEQPIAINFEGDHGKPYKPGKSMRRVMVQIWGPDGNTYTGRSMTLYRDEKVLFGGVAVGGIRISHMSHITKDITLALTATKASRKPFTVKPLQVEADNPPPDTQPKRRSVAQWLDDLEQEIAQALASEAPKAAVDAILGRDDVKKAEDTLKNGANARLAKIIQDAVANSSTPIEEDEGTAPS